MPEFRFDAIGTGWTITTPEPLEAELELAILDRIDRFDSAYSRFRADSLVTSLAAAGGAQEFPDDASRMFDLYDELFHATAGAVTPLVGRSLERLGYDREYSLVRRGTDLAPADWSSEVAREGRTVTTLSPVLIDVGAAGKGYLVDLVGEVLAAASLHDFAVNAGGDVLVSGDQPRRIALEHPFDPALAIGVVEFTNGSICASGSNRRVWGEGLHHILDGRTGAPVQDVIATWAIASTALVADGLATALFVASPSDLSGFDFEWVRVFSSGVAERSAGFPGELFS